MAVINMRLPELEENNGPVQLTDSAPYLYRQAPIITEKLSDKLIGGTVAWNQIVRNGNFSDDLSGWSAVSAQLSTQNGVLTVTKNENTGEGVGYARRTDVDLVVGHKYLFRCDYKGIQGKQLGLFTNSNNSGMTRVVPSDSNWHSKEIICNVLSLPSVRCIFWLLYETTTGDNTAQFRNINYFDLTQMFGAAIADYLYDLETATPGAGVALFRNLFPADYYAYNAGELISVKTSAHKMVGENQCDLETYVSTYTQGYSVDANGWVTIDDIGSAGLYARHWNVGNIVNGSVMLLIDTDRTTATNVRIRIYQGTTAVAESSVKLENRSFEAIGFNWSTNGKVTAKVMVVNAPAVSTWKPYTEHVYPLDYDLELRGIPKLDSANNLYYDGDVYESNGTVTHKYGAVDLGSLTWTPYALANNCFSALLSGGKTTGTNDSVFGICPKYTLAGYITDLRDTDKTIGIGYANLSIVQCYVSIHDSAYADAAAFKAAMSGVYLVYELADPTTESADPFTDPQDSGYTEQYIDERAVPIPVGHETTYFDMIQNVVIPMTLPMYDDNGGVVIPMALPYDTTQEE